VHHGPSEELARDPDVIAHYLGQAGTAKTPRRPIAPSTV